MFMQILLNKLHHSDLNARKVNPCEKSDAQLIASIKAKGLLENLIVIPHSTLADNYEVTGGGRRLAALKLLQADGHLPEDHQVACKLDDSDHPIETSLAENMIRAAMPPADEYEAFAQLVGAGATVSDIALRFGIEEKTVRQRLSLGKLAPGILEAYRNDEIDFERLKALTLTDDHELQQTLFKRFKESAWNYRAHNIKQIITEDCIPSTSKIGQFVSVDTYLEAGGAVTPDLFERDLIYFEDTALLYELVEKRLQDEKAALLEQGWKWVEAMRDVEHATLNEYGQIHPEPVDVPQEVTAEIDKIDGRLDELNCMDEDLWTEELDEEETNLYARKRELDSVVKSHLGFTEDMRSNAGCIAIVGMGGKIKLYEGLVRAEDMEPAQDEETPSTDQENGDNEEKPKEFKPGQTLAQDLTAHRLLITKSWLASDYSLAFDLLLYSLCMDVFNTSYYYVSKPLDLQVSRTPCRSSRDDIDDTPAKARLDKVAESFDLSWMNKDKAEAFAALSVKSMDEKQRLFAYCVAEALHGSLDIDDANPIFEATGERLNIDLADDWRPTADNFWGRINKTHGLAFASRTLGAEWALAHSKDKKATLCTRLEAIYGGRDAASFPASVREEAARWLPDFMTFGDAVEGLPAEPTQAIQVNGNAVPEERLTDESQSQDTDDLPAKPAGNDQDTGPMEEGATGGNGDPTPFMKDHIQVIHVTDKKPDDGEDKTSPKEQVTDITDEALPAFLQDVG